MLPFKILQGQDAQFNINVKVNDNAVDLSQYDGYIIIVMDSAKKIIARYSRETLAGYTPLDATDEATGTIGLVLYNSVTKDLANVQLYYVLITEANAGSTPFYSGSQTAQELVFVERSPLPLIPALD